MRAGRWGLLARKWLAKGLRARACTKEIRQRAIRQDSWGPPLASAWVYSHTLNTQKYKCCHFFLKVVVFPMTKLKQQCSAENTHESLVLFSEMLVWVLLCRVCSDKFSTRKLSHPGHTKMSSWSITKIWDWSSILCTYNLLYYHVLKDI